MQDRCSSCQSSSSYDSCWVSLSYTNNIFCSLCIKAWIHFCLVFPPFKLIEMGFIIIPSAYVEHIEYCKADKLLNGEWHIDDGIHIYLHCKAYISSHHVFISSVVLLKQCVCYTKFVCSDWERFKFPFPLNHAKLDYRFIDTSLDNRERYILLYLNFTVINLKDIKEM